MNASSVDRIAPCVAQPMEAVVDSRWFASARVTDVAVFDQLGFAVCVVDASGKVVRSNRAANAMFARQSVLVCVAGCLHSPRADVLAALQHAIARATRPPGHATAFSSPAHAAPAQRLQVRVAPLPDDGPPAPFEASPLALVLASVGIRPRPAQELRQLFGFTPSEAALAQMLVGGLSPAEIADARSVRLATVRTQLASVLAKTGTRSQAQFICLVMSLPASYEEPGD